MALAAGPKNRDTKPLPRAPGGSNAAWVELVTGEPLYRWQRKEVRVLTGRRRPRVAYLQLGRKGGKTRLAASVGLVEMCLKERRHIYCVSDSERNLDSALMQELREIIEGSEHLRNSVLIYKSHFECPETGSFIKPRAGNFRASQSINPHVVLFDEVHLQKDDTIWSGMQLAGAARSDALLLGITSPGYDLTSHAHSLYQSVRSGDPTIYGRIFEPANPDTAYEDRSQWKLANPRLRDDPGFMEALEFDFARLPEHEFRRFRLGMWTASASAWLPYGAWDACAAPGRQPHGRCWLGFDGSWSNDSTALMGVDETGFVFVVGCWENPGRPGWRVPRGEVEDTVVMAFENHDVVELACDPPYWQSEIERWSQRWPGRVVEFPTGARQRMAEGCTRFYAAVMERRLTHDNDKRLQRHLSNCVTKPSPWGDYISKPDPMSPAKIDLAVAGVVAHERAATAAPKRARLFVA